MINHIPKSKKCTICKEDKPADAFHVGKQADGRRFLQGRCKSCCREYLRKWSSTDTGKKLKARWQRDRNYEKLGISQVEYDRMNEAQSGCCAICGGVNASGKKLYVDHDHATGDVRGLLCHPCNVAIGLMKDNVVTLQAAISYLSRKKLKSVG